MSGRTAKRIVRALAWVALGLVLVVLVAVTTLILWARSPSGRRVILARVVALAQRQLAGRIAVGALDGDLTRQIVLRRVRVYDREQQLALALDAVRIDYDLLGLLRRRVRARSIVIEGARARVRRLRNGELNLARLKRTAPSLPPPWNESVGGSGRPWAVSVGTLRADGEILVETSSGPLHAGLHVTGALDWRADASVVDVELVVRPATGELRVAAYASAAKGRPVDWHASARSRDLDAAALVPGAPRGRLALAARAHGGNRTGTVDIEELTFDGAGTHASLRGFVELAPALTADLRADASSPELARLTGDALPALRGSVEAHAHFRRTAAHTLVDAAVVGRGLSLGGHALASLDGKLRVDEEGGHISARGRIDAAGPRHLFAEMRAHGVRLHDEGAWGVELTIDRLAGGEREGGWRLTEPGRLRVDRRAVTLALAWSAQEQTLALDAAIDRRGGRDGGPLSVDLRGRHLDASPPARLARIALPHTSIDVDARLRGTRLSPALTATVRGTTLPWPQHELPAIVFGLDATGDGRRLHGNAHAAAVGQEVQAVFDAPMSTAANQPLTGDVRGSGVKLETLRPLLPPSLRALTGAVDFSAHLSGTPRTLESVALRIRGRSLALPHLPIASMRRTPSLHADRVDVALNVRGPLRAAEAQVRGTASGVVVGAVAGLGFTLDGAYAGHRATATVDGTFHGRPLVTAQASSRVDLEQLLRGRDTPLVADVRVPALDLTGVGPLGGVVEATAAVRGTSAHPTLQAHLVGRDLQLSELRFATVEAHAAWDGTALRARLDGTQPSGGALRLDAALPAAADAPLHATLAADSFRFAVDDVGRVHRLEGVLAAHFQIGGSRNHPILDGSLRLDDGAFAAGNDPRLFHDVTLELDAHDDTIALRRFALRVARGGVKAHGSIRLVGFQPAAIELVAEAERFPFDATNSQAWANATIELHGHRVGEKLEGELTVSRGRAHLPKIDLKKELQSTAPLEDIVYVDVAERPREPARPKRPPPQIDVLARIPGPFKVDSPQMQAQLRGELEVRTVDGELGVFGHAETMEGRLDILGREYEIERARASFNGELDPVIDVRVTRVMGDAKLILSVHGTASAPKLELASDPPVYNPSQVLGLVLSGDPDNRRIYEPRSEQQVASAISGLLVSQLKGQLVAGLPLDVIQVEPTSGDDLARPTGARIELGTYIRRRVYVSYVHHFGATVTDVHRSNTHEVNIEYRVRRRMVLGVRYGDAGIGAVDFAWTFRY